MEPHERTVLIGCPKRRKNKQHKVRKKKQQCSLRGNKPALAWQAASCQTTPRESAARRLKSVRPPAEETPALQHTATSPPHQTASSWLQQRYAFLRLFLAGLGYQVVTIIPAGVVTVGVITAGGTLLRWDGFRSSVLASGLLPLRPPVRKRGSRRCLSPCGRSRWTRACCGTDPAGSGSSARSGGPGR